MAALAEFDREIRSILARALRPGTEPTARRRRQLVEQLKAAALFYLGEPGDSTEQSDPQDERMRRRTAQMQEAIRRGARSVEDASAAATDIPLASPEAESVAHIDTLDQAAEAGEDGRPQTAQIDTLSAQGGILQPPPKPTDQKPLGIRMEEVAQARKEIKDLQVSLVERIQRLLDQLAGRRGQSEEANKQIAAMVYDLARSSGTDLLCQGQPANIRWHGGVFEARTTDGRRKTLHQSADFPHLGARAKPLVKQADSSRAK